MSDVGATIRQVLEAHARLGSSALALRDDDDLYQRGLASHASVNVMLALEEVFEVEFPEDMLRKATFESVEAIEAALVELGSVSA